MTYDELSRHYLQRPQPHSRFPADVSGGEGCALLQVPPGMQLSLSGASLVSGVDFPHRLPADEVAALALCRALAEQAAVGALPAWVRVVVCLPRPSRSWVRAFSRRLYALADAVQTQVLGGELRQGPLSVQLQTQGLVEQGMALSRLGASAGDRIFVTGRLGGAALARRQLQRGEQPLPADLKRLRAPVPRLGTGRSLLGLASSCVSVRRGLKHDLATALRDGGLGGSLALDALPLSAGCTALGMAGTELALYGAGDGEMVFTAPESAGERLADIPPLMGELTCIGVVDAEPGLRGSSARRDVQHLPARGFRDISSPEDVVL